MGGQRRIFPLVLAGVILVLLLLLLLNDQVFNSGQLYDAVNLMFVLMVIAIAGYAGFMVWQKFKG